MLYSNCPFLFLFFFVDIQLELFPQLLLHFRAVSCTTGEGIKKLRQDIEDAVATHPV